MHILGLKIENGWILSAIFLLVSCLPMAFGGKGTKGLSDFSWSSTRAKIISVFFIVFVVYPCFLPIQSGPLFWVGVGLFVLSTMASLVSFYNYFTTGSDTLITKGLYQLSRNPIYVFLYTMILSIGLMCHSWFLVALTGLHIVLQHFIILEEEEFCLKTYGETYRRYRQAVPRYLLFF